MSGLTAEALSYDILPALRKHGMPTGFTNQKAFDELVLRLESSPTYAERAKLNNDLVNMQNGEVPLSTPEERALARSMSLLIGMSVGAYFKELNQLEMPKSNAAQS